MNKKLALMMACCAIAGLTACNESVEWKPQVLECIDGSMMCQSGNVNKCEGGQWKVVETCVGSAKPFCDSTAYTCTSSLPSACTDGNKLCEGNALKECVSGTWVLHNCGTGTCNATTLACEGGHDIPTPTICNPGCNGSELTTCNNGTATKTTCSGETPICDPYAVGGPNCVKADEVKDCIANAKKCEDVNGVPTAFVCSSDGKWDSGTACENGKVCSNDICDDEPVTSGCEYTDSNSEKKTLNDGDIICDGTLRVTCTGTTVTTDDCSDDGIDFTCSTASGTALCVSPAGCDVEGSETQAKHGDKMCKDSEIVVCDDGRWLTDKNCADDENGKVACLDAQCVACLADDKKCEVAEGVHTLYTCENNEWNGAACDQGLVCNTAKPSTSCVEPASLLNCDDIEGGNGSKCMDIYDQNYAVFCLGGVISDQYTENCTELNQICDYTSNNPECIDIPEGCKAEDTCNDTVIKDITCVNHFNDMYASGSVKCDLLCTEIDYSECLYCGDGKITATPNGEQCDGENIGEATCADVDGLDKEKTYTGKPGCENCVLTVGTCVEGGEQPQTGYTSIKQIMDDYDNIKEGKGLESTDIKGVVTASGSKGFTLQDPDGSENIAGVYVYCNKNCPTFPAVGKYVNVKSTVAVTMFNGLVEVTGDNTSLTITELDGVATATPIDKTIADITADGAKNAYASMLVAIKNVEVSEIELKNEKNYNVTLKSGEATTLVTMTFGGQEVLDPFAQDFLYNVTGVVYNNNKNYIGPRTAADIVITGCKDPAKTFNGNQAAPECTTGGGGENNKSCKGLDDEMIAHDAIGCIDATSYSICDNGTFAQETKVTCDKKYCNKAAKTDNERCVECLNDNHCAELNDDELHVVGICVSNACDIKCASTYAFDSDKKDHCTQLAANFVSVNEGKAYAQINQSTFPDNTIKNASFLCTTDKTKALSAWTKVTTTVNANYDPQGGVNVEYMADLSNLNGNNFCTFTFVVDDVTYIAEKGQSWVPVAAANDYKFAQNADLWTYEGQGGGGEEPEDEVVTMTGWPTNSGYTTSKDSDKFADNSYATITGAFYDDDTHSINGVTVIMKGDRATSIVIKDLSNGIGSVAFDYRSWADNEKDLVLDIGDGTTTVQLTITKADMEVKKYNHAFNNANATTVTIKPAEGSAAGRALIDNISWTSAN